MAATAGFEDAQFTCEVKPKVDPSLKVPVAVNCCEPPGRIEALPGAIAIEFRVALVTVKRAVPDWPANTAEMVLDPGWTPAAEPAVLCALLIVATEGFEEVQATNPVRS